MDLETYRQKHGLTYQELASQIGLAGHSSAWRLARGAQWPVDPERIERIVAATRGEVTVEAMHRQRLIWWRSQRAAQAT